MDISKHNAEAFLLRQIAGHYMTSVLVAYDFRFVAAFMLVIACLHGIVMSHAKNSWCQQSLDILRRVQN